MGQLLFGDFLAWTCIKQAFAMVRRYVLLLGSLRAEPSSVCG